MGIVDLDFKPTVPVFDANITLGRYFNRDVRVDTVEGTLKAMRRSGIDRALVYSPHARDFDSLDGNQELIESINSNSNLVPKFACNPTFDNLETFANTVDQYGVRSLHMFPKPHNYPFKDWVVKPWLNWIASKQILLSISATDFDPAEMHDTIKEHPDVNVLLCLVHYGHISWAIPLLKSLPNLYVEISHYVSTDGISQLLDTVGHKRVLFGSGFPDFPMSPQLYHLHKCNLDNSTLKAVCGDNLHGLLMEG